MADDANFCDGRLRLVAFLRVVENGMPQRPSRFKRRVQPAERLLDELHDRDSSYLRSISSIEESRLTSSEDQAQRSAGCPQDLAGFDVNGNSDKSSINNDKEGTKTNKVAYKYNENSHMSIPMKSPRLSQVPSVTRKRQLPKGGLALLRTTTLEGLPESSNVDNTSMITNTETDPVEDSQLDQVSRKVVHLPHPRIHGDLTMKSPLASGMTCEPKQYIQFAVKGPGTSVSHSQKLPFPLKTNLHSGICRAFVADSFVGNEFRSSTVQKPQRRAKVITQKAKLNTMVAELALATGLLPTPAVHGGFPNAPGSMVEDQHNSSNSYMKPNNVKFIRVLSNSGESMEDNTQDQRHLARQRDSRICNQLSCISAPVRDDSEDSETELLSEHQFSMEDEGIGETGETEEAN